MRQKRPPMRMCTGCGEMKPKKDLVRVVKAPDAKDENGQVLAAGGVSLDLTGRKPGRGAYVCRNAACLKAARKARRFEKAFSCQIPSEVYDRLLSLLGLARRAGRLSLGNDPVLSSMEEGKAKLVLVCPDLSQRTLKGIESRAEAFGVPLVTIEQTMDQVSMSLGKRCGVLALNDEGFARKALTLTKTNGEDLII